VRGLAVRGYRDAGRLVLAEGDFFDIRCIAIYCQHRAQCLLVVEGTGLMRPLLMRELMFNSTPQELQVPLLCAELIVSRCAASYCLTRQLQRQVPKLL
jgi:hypothetical protein